MVFEIVILAIVIGKIKGGKIRRLEEINIRGWYLLLASFLLEIFSLIIITRTHGDLSKILTSNFSYIHIFIYSLLILGLVMNFRESGFKVILLGSIFNFFPLIFNAGKMPVSINALENAGLSKQIELLSQNRIMTHMLMSDKTKLNFLGDIIAIGKPYPFPKIISIGDILISIGIFMLVYAFMNKREKDIKEHISIFKA